MSSTKEILIKAKQTAKDMRAVGEAEINAALNFMADSLIESCGKILSANDA